MEKFFNLLALMSVPLTFIVCRTYVRTRLLASGKPDVRLLGAVQKLQQENADMRQRLEVLETIVTSPSLPSSAPAPLPGSRTLQRVA